MNKEIVDLLIENARMARRSAYVPYSNYSVGVSLLAKSGKIYVGSNYENASFGAGVCAERVALGNALTAGERDFAAICVCGSDINITPCGICRQSLSEFGEMEVITCDEEGNYKNFQLTDLLPFAFSKERL